MPGLWVLASLACAGFHVGRSGALRLSHCPAALRLLSRTPQLLKARGLIATGDLVVVVADVREEWGTSGHVDTIRSVQVGAGRRQGFPQRVT